MHGSINHYLTKPKITAKMVLQYWLKTDVWLSSVTNFLDGLHSGKTRPLSPSLNFRINCSIVEFGKLEGQVLLI